MEHYHRTDVNIAVDNSVDIRVDSQYGTLDIESARIRIILWTPNGPFPPASKDDSKSRLENLFRLTDIVNRFAAALAIERRVLAAQVPNKED